METSRRRFVKTSCLGALCFCGFGRLLGANTPALEDIEEASDTNDMAKVWIAELLTNLSATQEESQLRLLIKSASIAHFNQMKAEAMLAPFKGRLKDFISFIEKEWGWKCHFEENEKVLIADESKPFCVCPLINKDTDKLLPAMCYCSEGFAERMFSVVCEYQVEAVVISSVQRGDERCIYRIELNR